MNDNYNMALAEALEKEFSWLKAFEAPEHEFSEAFEAGIQDIFVKSEYTYVSIGSRRVRKKVLALLIAILLLAATGCAVVTQCIIHWNEKVNEEQGALEITFDIENPSADTEFVPIKPDTPIGYSITNEMTEMDLMYYIEYTKDDDPEVMILYSQDDAVENMSISIDNEENALTETTINGYKGYEYYRDGISGLYWTDGNYFFSISGNCDISLLWEMSEGMVMTYETE